MRDSVLRALREEPRVSGEQLGRKLSISRTAVWKHINELRRLGYRIESSPRLGYSLRQSASLLLPEEITPGLETRTIGRRIVHFREVGSTQDAAEKLARGGAPEGTVVIAESQTRGRGRMGRGWVSPGEGGVYLSIILRPDLPPARIMQVPLVAGIAVVRAIRATTNLKPTIKWPNDILIAGRKVCGILTEMSSEVDRVNYVLLGIGINVNTPESLLAGPAAGMATSIAREAGNKLSRVRLVQVLLNEFEALYGQFLVRGFGEIRAEWKSLSNTIGSGVVVSEGRGSYEGVATDIDSEGFLLVKINGETRRVVSGDISLR